MNAQASAAVNGRASPFFTTEHEMLRSTLRRFIDERVMPYADAWEDAGFVPREVLREMGALGLLGIRYHSRHGGSELDTLATVVLAEELGRSSYGGFAITVLVHTDMASPHLYHAGTPEQLDRYMPTIVSGQRIAAVAMTEADAGSDLASMRSNARREGDQWVLNGSKMFITNGVHGDIFFVAAKTGEPGRNRDVSMFIVEKGTPGFSVARPLRRALERAVGHRRRVACATAAATTLSVVVSDSRPISRSKSMAGSGSLRHANGKQRTASRAKRWPESA